MKRKLLFLGCALALTVAASVRPASAYIRYCNTFCTPGQSGPCNCPPNSYWNPEERTTCASWIDFCWHGYPP